MGHHQLPVGMESKKNLQLLATGRTRGYPTGGQFVPPGEMLRFHYLGIGAIKVYQPSCQVSQ